MRRRTSGRDMVLLWLALQECLRLIRRVRLRCMSRWLRRFVVRSRRVRLLRVSGSPPARDLAAVLGVNANTVFRALRTLRMRGWSSFVAVGGSR